ncbi:MAG: D-alanine--D-alanine ligase [Planctomycetes bacterium]|nr:D-alanine--D-alanine ligase [Planctomycetota bacterium]
MSLPTVAALESSRASALASAHVAVVFGGTSGERAVSLITGRDVAAALSNDADGRGPKRVTAVELDATGRWCVGGEWLAPSDALRALAPLDLVFLGLHGGDGENGTLQGWLELQGVAYTGSGAQASALCMDKFALRGVVLQKGLRVAPGECVSAAEWRREATSVRARIDALGSDGWFVKPRSGGSSVATTSLKTLDGRPGLDSALAAVFAIGDDALVEARVRGVELSCGVFEGADGTLRVLPPVEIQPRAGAFFDYEEKYAANGAQEFCPPRSISAEACSRVQALARAAHEAARCSGYSRTDFIVPAQGEPVLLEVNTLPGLTPRSLLPQEAAVVGIDYRSLCLGLAEGALARRRPAP